MIQPTLASVKHTRVAMVPSPFNSINVTGVNVATSDHQNLQKRQRLRGYLSFPAFNAAVTTLSVVTTLALSASGGQSRQQRERSSLLR
jgi:hypothetical protein